MRPRLDAGWITIDLPDDPPGLVELAVGLSEPDPWVPAYRDLVDGARVLRVRPPAGASGRHLVWLRVNGAVTGPAALSL